MKFNLFGNKINNNLEILRANYIKENSIRKEIKMVPCSKFVACLDKLSKRYVLALTDQAEIETMKVANLNDIEFYEGYDIVSNYTDELRKHILKQIIEIYVLMNNVVKDVNIVENNLNNDNKLLLNDIKLNILSYMNIVNNIYQSISMTEDMIKIESQRDNEKEKISIDDILIKFEELINKLIELDSEMLIEFVRKQIKTICTYLLNYVNSILRIKK